MSESNVHGAENVTLLKNCIFHMQKDQAPLGVGLLILLTVTRSYCLKLRDEFSVSQLRSPPCWLFGILTTVWTPHVEYVSRHCPGTRLLVDQAFSKVWDHTLSCQWLTTHRRVGLLFILQRKGASRLKPRRPFLQPRLCPLRVRYKLYSHVSLTHRVTNAWPSSFYEEKRTFWGQLMHVQHGNGITAWRAFRLWVQQDTKQKLSKAVALDKIERWVNPGLWSTDEGLSRTKQLITASFR